MVFIAFVPQTFKPKIHNFDDTKINSNESIISLENKASGIYLMEINTAKGRVLKRLVKE